MQTHGRYSLIVVVVAVLVAACGGSETSSSEYDAVVAERDAALGNLAAAEQQLEETAALVDDLGADLDAALGEVERLTTESVNLTEQVNDLEETAQAATDDAAAAKDDAAAAKAEVEALKLQYDPEIRVALHAEIAAETTRACEQAKTDYDTSVATIVNWTTTWQAATTEAAMIEEVESCAAAERSKTAEQRERDRLAACESVDTDALEKNPDLYRDQCIHMWARVVQYDSATGVCTFRAETADRKSSRWYDYDGNAMFSGATDPVCPELDEIDNDDFVEIWATGAGTLTYDTTSGGSATATVWRIEKIDLWRKD
jgi:regulator of replication initiation timing